MTKKDDEDSRQTQRLDTSDPDAIINAIGRFHRETTDRTEDPAPDPRNASLMVWGSLHLQEKLGEGHFGEVFRAWDSELEREVAVKFLKSALSSQKDRILAEARLMAQVHHENVAQVYGAGSFADRAGFWMRLIPGQSLDQELSGRLLGVDEATSIATSLCRGLAAIHAKGIIHGDIKPGNIIRDRTGRVIITDFGVSRVGGSSDSGPVGTPVFMAPELFQGAGPSPASDIYSVGVLLFHLVSGRYPVEGKTLDQLQENHRSGQRNRLRDLRADLPSDFVRAVEQAVADSPATRIGSAAELELALGSRVPHRPSHWVRFLLHSTAVLAIAVILWSFVGSSDRLSGEVRLFAQGNQPLALTDPLEVGDRVFMELSLNQDAYVYVINEDASGQRFLLFPRQLANASNHLKAGHVYVLPGDFPELGGDRWELDREGGAERFLVCALTDRNPRLEAMLSVLEASGDNQSMAQNGAIADTLRGFGAVVSHAHEQESRPDLDRIAETLASLDGEGGDRPVWFRILTFGED